MLTIAKVFAMSPCYSELEAFSVAKAFSKGFSMAVAFAVALSIENLHCSPWPRP